MKLTANEFIKRFLYHIPPKRCFRIRYYGCSQKLSKIKNIKVISKDINTQNTNDKKPKCKKCQCTKSETILVVNKYDKTVVGLLTPTILELKKEINFNDST
jgi:hypothetical protein